MITIDQKFWAAPFLEVAEAITNECGKKQVSLREVLAEAGVSMSTWRRWRNGSVSPTFDKFGAIVLALHNR